MKVLLKQTETGRYFQGAERWTTDSIQALDFLTTPAAMDYSHRHGYNGMSIVLKFTDPRDDVELRNCC